MLLHRSTTPRRPPPLQPPGLLLLLRALLLCVWTSTATSEAAGNLSCLLVVTPNATLKVPVNSALSSQQYGLPAKIISGENMLSIAVDETRGFVYWGDGSKLKQATFDGYNEKVIIDTGLRLILGLAVDPTENKFYFINHDARKVEVVNADGSGRHIIIHSTAYPYDVAVHFNRRELFHTTVQALGIYRCRLDGSENLKIVSSNLGEPRAISIDYKNNSICWIDHTRKLLECSDYSGGNRRVYSTTYSPVTIQVENDVAYYTHWDPNGVNVMQLKNGSIAALDMGTYNGTNVYGVAILRGECRTGI